MQIYLAPMEGVTGYILRNAYHHHFDGIDKYFTPFIPAAKRLNYKIKRDILPENNAGIRLVPQLISNQAEEVLDMITQLKDFGYQEFNLNLGCPSGTVVSKSRGSGMLRNPDDLRYFLDGIYSKADVPVSVKTRIGFDALETWPTILEIYSQFPISELIIHPRLRREQYNGFPHLEAFRLAYEGALPMPLCYNGDLWNMECYQNVASQFPKLNIVMIGRGLLARPPLCCAIKGIPVSDPRKELQAFCDEVYAGYLEIFDGEKDVVTHMKEIWCNLKQSFEGSDRLVKKILKSQTGSEYLALVRQIFDTLEMTPLS